MDGSYRLESDGSSLRLIEEVFRGTVFRAPMTTQGHLPGTTVTIISSALLMPLRPPRITIKFRTVGVDVFYHDSVYFDVARFRAMKIPMKNKLTQVGYYRLPIQTLPPVLTLR